MNWANGLPALGMVAAGGAAGALARYLAGLLFLQLRLSPLWATLSVNVSGSFALGLLLAFLAGRSAAGGGLHLLAGVGFLGSFTTFSTIMGDTVLLTQQGSLPLAAFNLALSLALGLAAAALGFYAGRLL
ncbi:MAG: fluoride efflux transporter CrcB [Dehalococcoidia bacterium]|nr:fluoride efflux transporter CrcB [Dehalococcoidia bacterium]MSQ16307.1 fluoride efflux transporter CrcB [Dehalococcoidia bacterium]